MSLCQPNMCSFFFTSSPGSAYSPLAFFVASPGRLPTKSLRMIALVVVIAADIEKNPVPHQTLGQTNKPMYEPNKIHLFAGKLPCISWDLLRTRVYSTQKRTLPCTYFLRSRVYSTQKRTLPYSKFFWDREYTQHKKHIRHSPLIAMFLIVPSNRCPASAATTTTSLDFRHSFTCHCPRPNCMVEAHSVIGLCEIGPRQKPGAATASAQPVCCDTVVPQHAPLQETCSCFAMCCFSNVAFR